MLYKMSFFFQKGQAYFSFAFFLSFFAFSAIRVVSHETNSLRDVSFAEIQTDRTLFKILFAKTVRAKENRIKSNFLLKKGLTKVNIYNSEMAFVRGRIWKGRFLLSRRFLPVFFVSLCEALPRNYSDVAILPCPQEFQRINPTLCEKIVFGLTAFSLFILYADSNLLLF